VADLLAGLMRLRTSFFSYRRLKLSLIPGLLALDNDKARPSARNLTPLYLDLYDQHLAMAVVGGTNGFIPTALSHSRL